MGEAPEGPTEGMNEMMAFWESTVDEDVLRSVTGMPYDMTILSYKRSLKTAC